MRKGNVLVIGNSGVGKSTLINTVLGEEVAKTGHGIRGTTSDLEVYEPKNDDVPFRIIDSAGFEPGFIKERRAVNAVRKWSKECAKTGVENHQINVIWFCVDGTASKLFPKTIRTLVQATSFWKTVPIIVVITKSYSVPEREKNIAMVREAFSTEKKTAERLRQIIPVVASPFVLNENAFAPPEGIPELIDATNALMPEGLSAAEHDLSKFILKRKKALAQATVSAAVGSGALVASANGDFSDATLLSRIENAEINAISRIYGIKKNEKNNQLFQTLIDDEIISRFAKTLLEALQAVPEINDKAKSILNAAVAGLIIAGLGESTIHIFEQIFLGKESAANIDWVKKVLEENLSSNSIDKLLPYIKKIPNSDEFKDLLKNIVNIVNVVIKMKGK